MTYAKALQEAKDTCTECLTVNDCVKEECRWYWIIKALERQIPKKQTPDMRCPNCGHSVYNDSYKFCMKCGQAIDWGDNND